MTTTMATTLPKTTPSSNNKTKKTSNASYNNAANRSARRNQDFNRIQASNLNDRILSSKTLPQRTPLSQRPTSWRVKATDSNGTAVPKPLPRIETDLQIIESTLLPKRRSPRIQAIENQRRDDANATNVSSNASKSARDQTPTTNASKRTRDQTPTTARDQAPTTTATTNIDKVNIQQSSKPLSTTNQDRTNAPTTNVATNDTNLKGTTDTTTTTNHKDLSNTAAQDGHAAALEDEAQCLVGGTSEKFVPEPMGEDVTADLINGLRRFKDAVRCKVYFKLLQEEKDKENQSNGNIANNTQEEEQEQQPHNPGLKTNLKPIKTNLSAPRADDETERFLL